MITPPPREAFRNRTVRVGGSEVSRLNDVIALVFRSVLQVVQVGMVGGNGGKELAFTRAVASSGVVATASVGAERLVVVEKVRHVTLICCDRRDLSRAGT